jgi:hypothetical protein
MKKVNFFIIGQPKSGTTALYEYFRLHNNIYLPDQKQLYYFATDHNKERMLKKIFNKNYYKEYYNYNYKSYLKHFDFSTDHNIYCDITPDYFYSNTAASEIYKYNPDAKIILLLREPISFLKSFHNQMINSNCENIIDFWEAISCEKRRKESSQQFATTCPKRFYYYSELINYMKFIKPYYELFKGNFKIIIYENFKDDNFKYLDEIYNFIDIDSIKHNFLLKSNISVAPSKKFMKLLISLYPLRVVSSLIPIKVKRKLKVALQKKEMYSSISVNDKLKDDAFRMSIKNQTHELSQFLNSNDILLGNEKIDLINLWKYGQSK